MLISGVFLALALISVNQSLGRGLSHAAGDRPSPAVPSSADAALRFSGERDEAAESPTGGIPDSVLADRLLCRPSEFRPRQIGRRLPPSLSISPSYTCSVCIAARLLTVYIGHTLRQPIL